MAALVTLTLQYSLSMCSVCTYAAWILKDKVAGAWVGAQFKSSETMPAATLINKYSDHAAASVAMDGAAPDLGRDAPWREKQHKQGTTCP